MGEPSQPSQPSPQQTEDSEDQAPIFIPLPVEDPNVWDDSALIQAFERASASHKTAKRDQRDQRDHHDHQQKRKPRSVKRPRTSEKPTPKAKEPPRYSSSPTHPPKHLTIPPPPPSLCGASVPAEVEALLIAWYEAGYRAGMYAASNQAARISE